MINKLKINKINKLINLNIFHDELHHAFSNLITDTCDKFDTVF